MSTSNKHKKIEKAKELISFIVDNYNQDLYETKLWKLMFFVDSDYWEKYGESITGLDYIKNDHGPTPSYREVSCAIEELREEGYLNKNDDGKYHSQKSYEINKLNESEIDAIKATCEKYYKLNTNEICTLAHRDPVYLAAEEKNDILDLSLVTYRDDEGEVEEAGSSLEKIDLPSHQKDKILEKAQQV